MLLDCEAETTEFVSTMELLGEKLGPMLLQFPYFNHEAFATTGEFTARLVRFLDSLPRGHSYAVEIRNKNWLTATFVDLLRQKNVALALVDQGWMPAIDQLTAKLDVLTAGFTYVRLLGDRHAIEKQTKTWDKLIVNRERETQTWVRYVRQFLRRGVIVYVYVNNHFAGFGPGSIGLFYNLWRQTPDDPVTPCD